MENYNNLLYIDDINIDTCIKVLENRFYKKNIYTKLGSILLSINPYEYFEDVLRQFQSHPYNKLEELLPENWKKLHNK